MKNDQPIAKSIHLSASAGSGKTRALRDRYLALLDELERRGLGLDQSVAITFTDKAAAEIKERVLRGLPETVLKKIIRGTDDLRISTIHSFCMNLLKRYPLEAGLPPDFGVLDSRDQASKIERAIEDALEEADRDPGFMTALRDFSTDELVETTGFLLSIRSRLKRMEIDAGGPVPLLAALRRGMAVEDAMTELRSLISADAWKDGFRKMEELLRSQGDFYDANRGREHLLLVDATEPADAVKPLSALIPLYFTGEGTPRKNPSISKKAFIGKNRAEYEAAFATIQDLLARFRMLFDRLRAGREAESFLRLYQLAEKHYQEAKLREGLLDFDDLEIYAYGLLQAAESPDILYWLDRKILHFLVDEFQDTSDIQWAILGKLTEEIFAGQGAAKPMTPTIFVVGDEKQSIYRFREANYRLIDVVREKMELNLLPEAREIVTLDKNYRSTPAVVETVNSVFAALWGDAYKRSVTERRDHRGSVRLIELSLPDSGEKSAVNTEPEVLAREIASMISGGTTVYERTPEGGWLERRADYGDCAVLIQSRTKLKEYETALQAGGVPYRVIGGIGFYEEDEVQALMNVLFFLWNRDDRFALAAALKSPLFGLTDRDLFDLHTDGKDMLTALGRRHPPASELLSRWSKLAGLVPLSTLLHRIIEQSGAYVRFGKNNAQAIFNIDKFLDTAREFDRRGYTTLQDFVEWIRNIRDTEQREATADINLPGARGTVSILTVHKAKGLEYPIVFLPGMNQQPKSLSRGPRAVIEDGGGLVRMATKNEASPVYNELWEHERGELLREHQRLLYVAMTRAKDHLVMLGSRNSGKSPIRPDTWFAYLHASIPLPGDRGKEKAAVVASAFPDWQPSVLFGDALAVPPVPAAGTKSTPRVNTAMVRENLLPLPLSDRPEWKKATDFIHREKEESIEQLFLQSGTRAVSPLTRGSLLHRCLEEFTKNGTYALDALIVEFPDLLSLGEDIKRTFLADAGSVLDAVLRNDVLSWIFERRTGSFSELPFLLRKGHDIVSGIIDRVVIDGKKGRVIDYKSIVIENEKALAAWIDHYRPQLQIYCEAVKDIFALENVEGYLLFLDSNRLEQCVRL